MKVSRECSAPSAAIIREMSPASKSTGSRMDLTRQAVRAISARTGSAAMPSRRACIMRNTPSSRRNSLRRIIRLNMPDSNSPDCPSCSSRCSRRPTRPSSSTRNPNSPTCQANGNGSCSPSCCTGTTATMREISTTSGSSTSGKTLRSRSSSAISRSRTARSSAILPSMPSRTEQSSPSTPNRPRNSSTA